MPPKSGQQQTNPVARPQGHGATYKYKPGLVISR